VFDARAFSFLGISKSPDTFGIGAFLF